MESSKSFKSENPKLSPEQYIEKYQLETIMSEALNTIVSKKTKKPEAYLIKYLCSLLTKEEKEKHGIKDNSKEKVDKIPIVSFPHYFQNEIIKNNLTQNFWDTKKYVKSTNYHSIMDLFNKSKEGKEELGITIADSNCLEEYKDFLEPLFIEHFKLFLNQQTSYKLSDAKETISVHLLREFVQRKIMKFYRFEFRRNLVRYRNNLNGLSNYQAESMIEEVYEAVLKLNTYKEIQAKDCILIKSDEREFASLLSEYKVNLEHEAQSKEKLLALIRLGDILLLLNEDSHVRIIVCSKEAKTEEEKINEFNNIYHEVKTFTNNLEKYLQFEYDYKHGYVNSDVNHLGLSAYFYAEFHSPTLVSDAEFFNDFRANLMLKTLNKYAKFGKMEALGAETFKIEMNSVLNQSEQEFLEDIFHKLYNIDFIVNFKETSQSQWVLEKLNFDNLKAIHPTSALMHENFRLEKAYEKAYPLLKHIIYPNNLNLNTLINQLINNNVPNKTFSLFKVFFEALFTNFASNNSNNSKAFKPLKVPLADEPLVNSLNYNPYAYPFASEEYRINKSLSLDDPFKKKFSKIFESNVNNSKVHQAVKAFSIKLHRNFQNFDLPNFLNEDEKIKVAAIISEALDGVSDKIERINENLRVDKNFKIHVNTSDHLVLEFDTDFKTKEAIERVVGFLKSFKQISHKAEFKKNYFSVIQNVGYRVRDLSLLALGLDLSIELDLELLERKTLDKEFSLYRNKYPVSPISVTIDETSRTVRIENDKKFENYFNYMSLQNMLDRILELIVNLKVKESIDDEIREELKKVKVTLNTDALNTSRPDSSRVNVESINLNENSENLNSPINLNISATNVYEPDKLGNSAIFKDSSNPENNLSYEGSSIHLNDSKVSDKADDKSKINFENSAVNVSGVNDKKAQDEDEDDILIE